MKKIFTFLFLFFMLQLYSQNGTIKVKVQDICKNLFTKSLSVDLYKIDGADTIYKATSSSNQAIFPNISEAGKYMVSLSKVDSSKSNVTLKDLYYLRGIILGSFIQQTVPTPIIGSVDKNGGLSTLDLVLLSRYIIDLNPVDLSEWYFFSKFIYFEDGNNPFPSKKNTIVFNTNAIDTTEVISYAFKKGEIVSTLPAVYCNTCPIDSQFISNIFIPALDLKKDSVYNVEIKVRRTIYDLASTFSLNYSNIEIQSVNPEPYTNHYDNKDSNAINFLQYYFEPNQSNNLKIATLKIKALADGNLNTMLTLNPNFKNDFIYQDSSCIKSYSKIEIDYLPTGCSIQWPDDITVQDCNMLASTGIPLIPQKCSEIYYSYYTDEIIGSPCQKILRHWEIFNLITIEIFSHLQTITVNADYNIVCVDTQIALEEPKTIYAVDFVDGPIQGHEYSFSATSNEPTKLINYSYPFIEYLTIYDLSSNEFCVAKVTKLACKNVANVNEEVDVKSNGLAFYTVTAEMFNAGNSTNCLFNLTGFQISDTNTSNYTDLMYFPEDEYKGKSTYLKLRYQIEGNYVEHGLVKVNFIDQQIPVLNFNLYDDLVVKNEPIQIDFFSPNFNLIQALQGGILVKDAAITSTKKSSLKKIEFNQKPTSLRFVWLDENLQPISLNSTDTLFSMVILPNKSGKVSDFISLSDSLLPAEAVYNNLLLSKIDLVFNFVQRSSSTLDNYDFGKDILLSPNPNSGNLLNISAKNTSISSIKISDLNGRSLFEKELQDSDSQQIQLPNDMPNGLYLVEISSPKGRVTKKLIVAN